jgi:predicted CXXCH cytochrome family protein
MRTFSRSSLLRFVLGVAASASIAACTDTVYKDFPGFAPPPSGAGAYLGYTSSSGQLPVCGNCHASHQALWATAKHSQAWADLQASGHAGPTCDACHSVNTLGNNSATTPAEGYIGSPTERYQDVQCEACHGPGQTHVDNPEIVANQPVPSIYVAVGTNTSCSGCHTGSHNPFVEDWSKSAHGIVPDFSAGAGNTSCQPCHTGQKALATWFNVTPANANYKEINNPLNTQGPDGALTIVCAVCHDPHGSPNLAQLRMQPDTLAIEKNLCAQCHNRRAVPDPTSNRGPHAPEGALVIGENDVGWRPPLMTSAPGGLDRIFGSHGDTTVNKKLCATCHVFKTQSTDLETGAAVFSTGHLFLAIPCKDVNGLPDSVSTCGLNSTARIFNACAGSGCHGSGDVAANLLNTEILTINGLLAQLQTLLNNTSKIPCSQYAVGASAPWTTARGARFNYLMAAEAASTSDATCGSNRNLPPPKTKPGAAAHNVPLMEQLLQQSINQVIQDYP